MSGVSEHVLYTNCNTFNGALQSSLALARKGYHVVISPDNLLINYEWVSGTIEGFFSLYECRMPNFKDGKKYTNVLPYPAEIHSLLFEEFTTSVYVDTKRKPTSIVEVVQLRIKMGLTD